jgi:uncharacterized membrane-anchored protein
MTKIRALQPNIAYWVAMYAASALGTNLGDFWSDTLGLGLGASFASLAALSLVLIAVDRAVGLRTELIFWLALVILRAMATNVGDYLTDDMGISRLVTTPALGALTLAAGYLTIGVNSPRVDARYWLAMALGGAFGTVAGDLASHTVGLPLAAGVLALALVACVAARSQIGGAGVLSYWAVVLVERAAGTPAGDLLAEGRGLGLGLPVAMTITGGLFVLAVLWRLMRPAADVTLATAPAR